MNDSALPPAVSGVLHLFIAYDWGEALNLETARKLVPAESLLLPRRRRTPSSISYRPAPLRVTIDPITLDLPELGAVPATAEATIFDFAGVSLALRLPLNCSPACLIRVATWLAEPTALNQAARAALGPLHAKLQPAIENPQWADDLSEEYAVFHLAPCDGLTPDKLLGEQADWVAGLVRLETESLSAVEREEALRLRLRYGPGDLFVCDWAAAVLMDDECEETLRIVEFANLQLLEFRHLDQRLDGSLATAYRLIHRLTRRPLPFWSSQGRRLRVLGELKVEATELFERLGNVLKLVGDQYLARVYRLLATRFHLGEWEESIQRKLEVIEGIYQVLSDQALAYRAEFLEIVVVLLILLEVVLTLRH